MRQKDNFEICTLTVQTLNETCLDILKGNGKKIGIKALYKATFSSNEITEKRKINRYKPTFFSNIFSQQCCIVPSLLKVRMLIKTN